MDSAVLTCVRARRRREGNGQRAPCSACVQCARVHAHCTVAQILACEKRRHSRRGAGRRRHGARPTARAPPLHGALWRRSHARSSSYGIPGGSTSCSAWGWAVRGREGGSRRRRRRSGRSARAQGAPPAHPPARVDVHSAPLTIPGLVSGVGWPCAACRGRCYACRWLACSPHRT